MINILDRCLYSYIYLVLYCILLYLSFYGIYGIYDILLIGANICTSV